MHILITGADGFIGSALAQALLARGHQLTLAVRDTQRAAKRFPGPRAVVVDFTADHSPETWRPRLQGIDAVVNTVGIFRETGAQTFEAIHVRTPIALFEACIEAGVRRVVQISALGAAADAPTEFLRSKHAADTALSTLPLPSVVVRPSLVFARAGTSARLFLQLAALPLIPIPGNGTQCVQPIHLGDLVTALVALIEAEAPPPLLAAVGPQPLTLRDYLAQLRRAAGLGRAHFLPIPERIMDAVASVGERLRTNLVDREALTMLAQGNCADAQAVTRVLGHPPRGAADFIATDEAAFLRTSLQLHWLLPLLRLSVALVWIVTGIVSLGVYPVSDSLDLLARVGLHGRLALASLYAAAVLDLALGIATLVMHRRQWLYAFQALVILGYTAIITLWLPEYWLHPYGPVLKNLPLLAALWLLFALDHEENTPEESR
ncbi:MAG TPA: NAD(P)H-binding protein [Lysobacter sp.]